MKVFKLVFLVLFAGLFFMACSQEDGLIQKSSDFNDVVKNEVIKMVPFKGTLVQRPSVPNQFLVHFKASPLQLKLLFIMQ